MQDKQAILETDNVYHVYNRANGSERMFVKKNTIIHSRFIWDIKKEAVLESLNPTGF
ncbi:MAG: hypothetical protein ACJAUV_002343 [Flavobacteriales bacterium]|jgi:hypothetical protein